MKLDTQKEEHTRYQCYQEWKHFINNMFLKLDQKTLLYIYLSHNSWIKHAIKKRRFEIEVLTGWKRISGILNRSGPIWINCPSGSCKEKNSHIYQMQDRHGFLPGRRQLPKKSLWQWSTVWAYTYSKQTIIHSWRGSQELGVEQKSV